MKATTDLPPAPDASQAMGWRRWLRRALGMAAHPKVTTGLTIGMWALTRLVLLAGVIIGGRYCDPQFYDYAGKLAAGLWPYRDVPVEYPPMAIVLLLLPAVPLLPFSGIAPRPDPAFLHVIHLPAPDPIRYGAFGVSFAVEMLIIDALTLWLVMRGARRIGQPQFAAAAGLVYILLTFLSGGVLQKFDLAVGTLLLAGVLALVDRKRGLAWTLLAGATLIKGYPLLAVPIFVLYELEITGHRQPIIALKAALRPILAGLVWFVGAITFATLAVAAFAGWAPILHTITYHAGRGVEIESLYSIVALIVSWAPGLSAHTTFNPQDLSRIVISPLTQATLIDRISTALLGIAALATLGSAWIAWRGRTGRAEASHSSGGVQRAGQALAIGVTLISLAFTLTFRALPTHYLLDIIPLAVVLWLGSSRRTVLWLAAIAGVGVLGQIIAIPGLWHELVALNSGPVGLLVLRDILWVFASGTLVWALWHDARVQPKQGGEFSVSRDASQSAKPLRQRFYEVWRRVITSAPPIPGFQPRSEDVFAHLFAQVSPLTALISAGVISTICYAGLTAAFPLVSYYSRPHISPESSQINDMGAITGYSAFAAISFVLVILLLFGAQFVALLAAGRVQRETASSARKWAVRLIFGAPIIFALIMIWMQPVTTTDLYGYVARGYLYTHFHLDPMMFPASRLPGGYAVDRPASPYGPVWLMIAAAFSWVSGENLLLNMLLYKIFSAIAVIVALALVNHLAQRLYPERRLRIAVLFGWSPLLLFEAVGNGHNDIVMIVCVLAAFALMLRGRSQAAFALLVVGAVIKYVSAFFVPLWLVYELRHRALKGRINIASGSTPGLAPRLDRYRRAVGQMYAGLDRKATFQLLAPAVLIGAVITFVSYAPFWAGIQTFTGLGQQLRPLYYNGSIVQFITAPLELLVQPAQYPALDKTVRLVFYSLFLIYGAIQTRRLWTLGDEANVSDLITAAAKITFAALVLITFWFQPWYIVWLLPLAALAREPYVRRQGALISIGALLTYAVSNFLLVGEPGIGRDLFVQFFEALLTFAPLLFLRAAPYEEGWISIVRRYTSLFAEGFARRPIFWQRIMLALVLVVAAILRLLRLGSFSFSLTGGGADVTGLKQISGDLRLFLADPQGLNGPFAAINDALLRIFGPTPIAVLLPAAFIGTFTVLMVYALTVEILRQTGRHEQRGVAILAALLAATSRWHVSLSRSGMEVVLLPFLVCVAIWALLRAFHLLGRDLTANSEHSPSVVSISNRRRAFALFSLAGLSTGLACDLAPGLWLLPILVAGFLLMWRWRRATLFKGIAGPLAALVGVAILSALPALWYLINPHIGFAVGSNALAQSSEPLVATPGPLQPQFWASAGSNALDVLRLLITQDYSAGYPAVGGVSILPGYLGVFFYLGLAIVAYRTIRRRDLSALAIALLLALPLVATVVVTAPTGIIEAASVLPATCIVPALAIYEIAAWAGRLPIALDRMNGVRVFTTPEQIGRIVLFLFLFVSAVRTFYWYFEATLPASPINTFTPSDVALRFAVTLGRELLRLAGAIPLPALPMH